MAGIIPALGTRSITCSSENKSESNPEKEDHYHEKDRAPNFFEIRKKFEEKSKIKVKNSKLYPVLVEEHPVVVAPVKVTTEFQKLYPIFKEHLTKRQFAALENLFESSDKNNDGFLEPKEIKQLLVDHNHHVNLCDADFIVNLGDQDQDGKLSAKEFLELCKPTAETLKHQQHMEGSYPPSDREFIAIIIDKLRGFVSPISSKVKGTRQFFENIISTKANPAIMSDKEIQPKRPLRRCPPATNEASGFGMNEFEH